MEELLWKIIKTSSRKVRENPSSEPIPNGPNPLTLSKWYAKEITWANSQIDSAEAENNAVSSCRKGCTSCCKQAIAVLSSEMLAIKPSLTNLSKEQKSKLYEDTTKICEELKENGIDSSFNIHCGEAAMKRLQDKYFSLGINCPLLDQDGTCSVYSVRPMACWSYRYYGDAKECELSYDVPNSIKYDDWEKAVLERLFKAKKPDKKGIQLLPFALKEMMKEIK